MTTGFRAYAVVLSDPRARAFSAAGFLARMPLSMTGIGTVLLVSLTTGSFGRAGLITAVGTAVGAVAAPLWGRVVDRVGQAPVLAGAAVLHGAGVALVVAAVLRGWPLGLVVACAALGGLGATSAGSCVRARWSHRLGASPLLNTAFAVEAMVDEVVFILGPVLTTVLATAVHPALGLAVSGALGVLGALALAVQRGTEPPVHPRPAGVGHGPLPVGALTAIAVAGWACGSVFGGMEVVVIAFAREAGVLGYSGVLLMCWALGSLLAGLVAGSLTWRRDPVTRFRIGSALLALSLLPLPFVASPVVMGALLVLSGIAIAPTLIAWVSVTQATVQPARITEALGWTSTGMAAGVATGAASTGPLIDRAGATAGFWGTAAFGVLLTLSVLLVRVREQAPLGPFAKWQDQEADR